MRVSIPDLVGLGVRARLAGRGPCSEDTFQSPIWWGWGLEKSAHIFRDRETRRVSIPDLVGLGVRAGEHVLTRESRGVVSIPDLVGLGVRAQEC